MYIYIGADFLIKEEDIVGVFDLETTTVSRVTRDYLTAAQKNGRITDVSSDFKTAEIPKSYVICRKDDGFVVYLSRYSTSTINKRRIFGDNIKTRNGKN